MFKHLPALSCASSLERELRLFVMWVFNGLRALFLGLGTVVDSGSVIKLKVSSAVCIRNADVDGASYDSQVFFQRVSLKSD